MGHNRRRENWEIVEAIKEAEERIQGVSLGAACATNVVVLEWACYRCPRRGRYRLTRVIDHHGPKMQLIDVQNICWLLIVRDTGLTPS
jgi:hypothetical protein